MTERNANSAPSGSKASRRPLVIALAVAVLFGALGFAGYRWAQDDALATLVAFTGQPERDIATQQEQWRAAESGDDFMTGDGARTAEESDARFRLLNGATLKLYPSSLVRFERSNAGSVKVDVEVGQADVVSGSGKVTIGSEFGEIVLDANSSVTMTRDGDHLNVGVELGSIQVASRAVKVGESLSLDIGGIVVDVPLPEPEPEPAPIVDEAEQDKEAELEVGDGVSNAELVVAAGDSFVVHDPRPPTSVGFRTGGVCTGPAQVKAGALRTEARGQANLSLSQGQHQYEVRCLDKPDIIAAKGTVRVLRDAGTRKLPTFTPTANVTTDGRRYTVMYQHRLPNVTVSWPTAPQAEAYSLTIDGRTIQTNTPSHTFRSLHRGSHKVSFSAQTTPARQSRTSTVEVVYDVQAPAARVSDPPVGFEAGEEVSISGQALPGWDVSVAGQAVDVDEQRNFTVKTDGREPIPITFSHPSRGTHYYIRRPSKTK